MIDAVLFTNEGTTATTRNGHLDGVAAVERPQFHAVRYKYYWRWYDTPEQEPQFLCEGVVNQSARVPFDTQQRDIVIMQVAFDAHGRPNVTHPREGASYVFTQNTVASLVDATFSSGTVTLTIANNGGSGNINIRRRAHGTSDPFGVIASVAPSTTSTTDTTITLAGDYDYDLTQDGLLGSSNIKTITATFGGGGGTPTGTTPDGLGISDDGPDGSGIIGVHLNWTNHGATDDIRIWHKVYGGVYEIYDTVSSSTTIYDTFLDQVGTNKTHYFYVDNPSASGTSNEVSVFIPRLF